jgi:NAD(P)-dependent dehydrogenase (short-subunit alcohol dehydrogenase family)
VKVADKVCVVTGGASGIGAALCARFAAEGAAGVVVVDRNEAGAREVATAVGGLPITCDVGSEDAVNAMVRAVTKHYGQIDVLCSNAGIVNDQDFLTGSLEPWEQQWRVNVMSHVYGARAVLPQMLARRDGVIVHTASIAGILTAHGWATYTSTKHAVVGLAEWLALTYGRRGIQIHLLAPLGVETPMLAASPEALRARSGATRTAEEVAGQVIDAFAEERFLILTDPVAHEWMRRKTDDIERWLEGMRRVQDEFAQHPTETDGTGR